MRLNYHTKATSQRERPKTSRIKVAMEQTERAHKQPMLHKRAVKGLVFWEETALSCWPLKVSSGPFPSLEVLSFLKSCLRFDLLYSCAQFLVSRQKDLKIPSDTHWTMLNTYNGMVKPGSQEVRAMVLISWKFLFTPGPSKRSPEHSASLSASASALSRKHICLPNFIFTSAAQGDLTKQVRFW